MERQALLATKLHLPRPAPGCLVRSRLLDRLDAAPPEGLVLICAPAGFGKTALLAEWVRESRQPAAWLSLDAGDSDPARFWRHVLAALDRPRPGVAALVMPLLEPAPPSFEGVVTALVNALAEVPGDDVRLVLDDYHLIDSPPVHESLMFLLDHLPPGLCPVLASRTDPPITLARLRVRGQLTELRAADLRLTAGEAAVVLREATGRDLPESAVAALEARTEGWAAGLHLAGLSLRGHPDAAAFVSTFSGSHRYVMDYLTEEVLDAQPESVRRFLLDTSVLERLSGPLCDAVTGSADGQAMLEDIEATGLFLMPLDEVRGWWRYHHLFADLLRARLRRERPERVPTLHRDAARWHEAQGFVEDAVHHALACGETAWAAGLIEKEFDALFYQQGEGTTVQRWMSALPADLVRTRPRLLVAQAAVADASGRYGDVEGLLTAAEQAADTADEPFQPSTGAAASLLVNVPATIAIFRAYTAELRGNVPAAAAFGARARAAIRPGEQMLDFVSQGTSAVADWSAGQAEEAERALSLITGRGQVAGQRNLIGWSAYHLGRIQCALGRLDAAQRTYERTLESTAPHPGLVLPAAGISYAGLADVAYQRNELDVALRHATEGVALCRQFTFTPPLATALATLAWIRQAQGYPDRALEAISEAAHAAPRSAATDLLIPAPAQRARLLLAQGDLAAAERWTRERGLAADHEPEYVQEAGYLMLARLLLAQDRPGHALPLLQRMHAAAIAQHRLGSVIELRALQALALAACGRPADAGSALAGALTLGHAEGYVRVFVDEGAPMQALLGRFLAAQRSERATARAVPLGYIARLLRGFGGHAEPGAAASSLPEPLTAREIEVLALLAAGESNRRIAEELVVSLDTVKKHVSHVLAKLGAINRTEAVTRGRALGLIG